MGRRVYIETSVISYLVARPSRNILAAAWQQVTQEWWDKQRARFELFTSELVLAEAAQGDPDAAQRPSEPLQSIPDLEVTDEVVALAKRLVKEGALPVIRRQGSCYAGQTTLGWPEWMPAGWR
jgi:hypothetical protein